MLDIPLGLIPECIDAAICSLSKEYAPIFISKLAIAITGEEPFKSGSKVDDWLNQQDVETLKWVLYYTVYCFTH